jgi:predicted dehydrogenase
LKSGKLGRIVEFEAHYDRYRPIPPTNTWKEDEKIGPGLLYNLGAHLIDQALVLFGRPVSVFADLDIMRSKGKIIDYFNIILFYPNHRAILKSSYLAKEPAFKYMIQGENGSFFKSGSDPQEERLDKGWKADDVRIGKEDESIWGRLFLADQEEPQKLQSENGNYLGFYDDVWKAIHGESNNAVRASEGLEVIEIIEASIKSNNIGSKIKL